MEYIDKEKKQLIIDQPIYKSTTKTITKDGKQKDNIKYLAHIPNIILIFLLEKFASFNPGAISDAEYIDAMLNGNEKFFLSFYDPTSESDDVKLQITNEKISSDIGTSISIKKQVNTDSYLFTVSKKVFKQLKNNSDFNYVFRFVLCFDFDSDCFKNYSVDVMVV